MDDWVSAGLRDWNSIPLHIRLSVEHSGERAVVKAAGNACEKGTLSNLSISPYLR